MKVKQKFLEYFGDGDWEDIQFTPNEQLRMIVDLKTIIINGTDYSSMSTRSFALHRFSIVDAIETVFCLYRYDKPNKAKFLSNVIIVYLSELTKPPSNTLTAYNVPTYSNDQITSFDLDDINEFVVQVYMHRFTPSSGKLTTMLNPDVLTFMEL